MPVKTAALRRFSALALLGGVLSPIACGRTELPVPPQRPPPPECDVDDDCPGNDDLCEPVRCVTPTQALGELDPNTLATLPPRVCFVLDPVDCDDNDPCTADQCDRASGLCAYAPSTFDLDGDGFLAPRTGYAPGAPDACGDDCNDASAAAYPGGTEICDGVDNDCNGVVDDGAEYLPIQDSLLKLSIDPNTPAEGSGLAFSGSSYMATFTASNESGFSTYQTLIRADGTIGDPDGEKFTFQNADSTGAVIRWIGDRYGVAWQDRRDNDYEVYFTILKENGDKVIPDRRLTFAGGFSVNVSLAWTGLEFLVTWQDERDGTFDVFAQRLDVDGNPVGSNVLLVDGPLDEESPEAAAGDSTMALVWSSGSALERRLWSQVFDLQSLTPVGEPVPLTQGTDDANYPVITWNEDRYVVAWYEKANARAIMATTLDESGAVITPAQQISFPGPFRSRYPNVLPLGDRALFVFADDRDGGDYELYSHMVDRELLSMGPERRITFAPFDSISPISVFGPDGNVGILFRDDREGGVHHVFFTELGCATNVN